METKKLDILMKAIKIGSLKKAADQLNYTQTGLIYLVNSIEDELGIPLLTRTHKGISLSEEGVALEPYIQSLLNASNDIKNEISRLLSEKTNTISIGATPNMSKYVLPTALTAFLKKYPDINVTVEVGANELSSLLDLEKVDILLAEESFKHSHMWIPLIRDYVCVVLRTNDPLANLDEIHPTDINSRNIICSNYLKSSFIIDYIEKYELHFNTTLASPNATTLFEYIRNNIGISMISSVYNNSCPDDLKLIPLNPPINRTLGVIHKRNLSSTLQDLVNFLQKECKKLPSKMPGFSAIN